LWNPVLYATFIGVSRTSGKEQFTMLFLILTLSIGIFSANSARTINKNIEDKVRYETGSDIVVEGKWTDNRPMEISVPGVSTMAVGGSKVQQDFVYFEPPFKPYTELNGVESLTKVLKAEGAEVILGSNDLPQVTLMGIIPNEFGKTAWFRSDLLPYHWYNYLNLMTDSPTAMLVSSAFKDKLKARVGDQISLSWGEGNSISGIIYAFIDYWPSLNPNKKIENTAAPYFVVANLNYIYAKRPVEPYQVWMKKKPGTTSNEIYKQMEEKKIILTQRKDMTEKLIKQKNDPILQGTNGSLTLGFIVTAVISIIGFLIYWIMSIKKRVLQFGIFRAMGLTSDKIILMLAWEQLMITGTSVLAGVGIGSLAGRIFVPLLQLVYGAEEQVPPFKVISYTGDYIRLYILVALMLVACFTILWNFISRINVGQALKLGED
jgi:putative ABC transport system permease protein